MLGLRGARTFDGREFVEDATVIIDGTTIAGVERRADVDVVDLGDVTLLPGLIDCHQHLCFDGVGTLEEQVVGRDDAELADRARASASRALAAGITTLRDLGDRGYVTLDLRGDASLPTIHSSGPPITRLNGHCWYLGGECDGDDSLRAAVSERDERGCDVVKVMVSGGALTPTFPMSESQFTTAELAVIVDEAHRRGLPVAAHCHAIGAIESALDVGADSIEHCTFMNREGRADPQEDLLARVATSGVAVSLTVGRLPEAVINPRILENMEALLHSRRRLVALGATIVPGTDAGITTGKPHDVLPHALEDFLAAGMTAGDALRAMTSVAAGVLGLGDRKGRLATGFDADVLAVRGDPRVAPAALLDVVGVWRAGAHAPAADGSS